MRKRKSKQKDMMIPNAKSIQEEYSKELDSNPKYSLEIDEDNKYSFTDIQKSFISSFVQYKSLNFCAARLGLSLEVASDLFETYSIQQEIKRLNMALYHRRFASKMMSLDDLGGYLSSIITEENTPLSERVSTKDKIQVAKMIMDLNVVKSKMLQEPQTLTCTDINVEIKNLSVQTIKNLLSQENNENKVDIVDSKVEEQFSNLSVEEQAFLHSLSSEELLKLIEETNLKSNTTIIEGEVIK